MTGRHRHGAPLIASVWFVSALVVAPAPAAEIAGCVGSAKPFAMAEAAGARDAHTIQLTDGREVRLAGIASLADSQSATAAIGSMVAGQRVALYGSAESTDRYGRLVAQIMLVESVKWLQSELVLAGLVHAAPASGAPDCAAALVRGESRARQRRAGLWADGTLAVKHASAPRSLLTGAGGFAVVEGTVVRVGEAGGRLFLDFGHRYSRDFSIVVPRDAQATFAKAGLDLRGLSGKRVRARGVLFEQGGPAMELRSPAALEVIGADGA